MFEMDSDTVDNLINTTMIENIGDISEAWKMWGAGLSIVTVSAFGAPAAIIFVPLLNQCIYEKVMSFLVALGIGALSGSIMFIMLPQAFGVSDSVDSNYLVKSWIVLGALYGFFAVDRLLQYVMEIKRRLKSRWKCNKISCCSKGNSFSSKDVIFHTEKDETLKTEVEQIQAEMEISAVNNAITRTYSSHRRVPIVITPNDSDGDHSKSLQVPTIATIYSANGSHSLQLPQKEIEEDRISISVAVVEQIEVPHRQLEVASVAYMIIVGAAANNFVDGMSNGVAFADSLVRGLSIGLACIAQQFPQEVGTLAILVRTGLGFKKTLLLNLIPATLSYVGFTIGALINNICEGSDKIVFAVSSGMYLYIFLGTLIPEVRESFNELVRRNIKESLITTILQVAGISFGVGFLYFMSVYGKKIEV